MIVEIYGFVLEGALIPMGWVMAYAGLVFDLVGALYSHLSVGDPPSSWIFPIIGLLLVLGSYLLYQKKVSYQGSELTGQVVV